MAAMDSFLITVDGSEHQVSTDTLRHLLDTSARFWLDLAGLDKSTADRLLRDTFGFHPLAVEDAEHFGQRPKIDPYDHFTLMVVYGANSSGQLVEVHCFYTGTYLVTVHRDACPELTGLAGRLQQRAEPRPDHVMLLYLVVDTLIDGYFPVLADLDDRIDELEDAILQRPTDQQLGQLFDMKRSLIASFSGDPPHRDVTTRSAASQVTDSNGCAHASGATGQATDRKSRTRRTGAVAAVISRARRRPRCRSCAHASASSSGMWQCSSIASRAIITRSDSSLLCVV
jgi:Mg2+ and Co2+ transporter CorA